MGFSMPHITILAATGVVSVALLFQIIGVAAPGWVIVLNSRNGLWQVCSGTNCVDWPSYYVTPLLKAVRAFGLMGVIVMGVSVLCGILTCFLVTFRQILTIAAPFAALLGAIFSIIEWAAYVGGIPLQTQPYLDYSFGLSVTATILCFIAAGLFLLGRNAMRSA